MAALEKKQIILAVCAVVAVGSIGYAGFTVFRPGPPILQGAALEADNARMKKQLEEMAATRGGVRPVAAAVAAPVAAPAAGAGDFGIQTRSAPAPVVTAARPAPVAPVVTVAPVQSASLPAVLPPAVSLPPSPAVTLPPPAAVVQAPPPVAVVSVSEARVTDLVVAATKQVSEITDHVTAMNASLDARNAALGHPVSAR